MQEARGYWLISLRSPDTPFHGHNKQGYVPITTAREDALPNSSIVQSPPPLPLVGNILVHKNVFNRIGQEIQESGQNDENCTCTLLM